jgi:predicted nucleic acid-binding protein
MFLLDHSAWSRFWDRRLPDDRVAWVAEHLDADELGTCLPFLLEAGYSARSFTEYEQVGGRLGQLPRVAISEDVERLALEAQRELARVGHHRLSPSDLIVAACAHVAHVGVLHYDHDFDRIAEMTSLRFHSEWLAPAGTL